MQLEELYPVIMYAWLAIFLFGCAYIKDWPAVLLIIALIVLAILIV